MLQVFGCFFCFAYGINTAQGIQGGTVPESAVTGLGKQTVFSPEARREQSLDGSFFPFADTHGQRNADPGAQDIVAFVIVVSVIAFHGSSEIFFNGFAQVGSLLPVGGCCLFVFSQILCQKGRAS